MLTLGNILLLIFWFSHRFMYSKAFRANIANSVCSWKPRLWKWKKSPSCDCILRLWKSITSVELFVSSQFSAQVRWPAPSGNQVSWSHPADTIEWRNERIAKNSKAWSGADVLGSVCFVYRHTQIFCDDVTVPIVISTRTAGKLSIIRHKHIPGLKQITLLLQELEGNL